jgi:hypothetical protein
VTAIIGEGQASENLPSRCPSCRHWPAQTVSSGKKLEHCQVFAGATVATSCVITLKSTSVHGPNVVTIATSKASRPRAHQYATNTRLVVAGIKGVPAVTEIGFELVAEIHRTIVGRHADVLQIAGAVARRNIHAAAQRDGKVGKIAAQPRRSV